MREGLELAASVGAPIAPVSPGSPSERRTADADETYIRRLARVAPLAKELGVTMLIEPLHPFLHAIGYIHARLACVVRSDLAVASVSDGRMDAPLNAIDA